VMYVMILEKQQDKESIIKRGVIEINKFIIII
jgi:hypothetical protein